MKKKILGIFAIAAIAVISGYNVYTSQNKMSLSDLALNNVEALASSREWGDQNCFWVDSNYISCTPWERYQGCPCYS